MATMAKLDKSFKGLVTGSGFNEFIKSAVNALAGFAQALLGLPEFISRNAQAFIAAGTALLAYNARLITSTSLAIANTTATVLSNAAYAIGFKWLVLKTATMATYDAVVAATTLRTKAAAVATGEGDHTTCCRSNREAPTVVEINVDAERVAGAKIAR